jgi:riboflavin-specific deaminase-like protein
MNRRPRTTLSYAQSLDGRIATSIGDSQWISGDETLELAHRLRNDHDAVMVGIGTVLADDPRLTCRLPGGRNPRRIILDSQLRLPADSQIATQAPNVATIVFCDENASTMRAAELREMGLAVESVEAPGGALDLQTVLARLRQLGIGTLLVEGGSGVITSFFRQRLVDRLVLVSAPIVIGTGTEAVRDLGIRRLAEAQRGTTTSVSQAGDDIVWEMRFGES